LNMDKSLVINTVGLSKFFGKRKIIDNVGLCVEEGDIYGFLGANGSGKTTTIRMLLGLIHPDEGQIFLNGHDIRNQFCKAIAEVGAIVENPSFYNFLSGYENLKLMASYYPQIDNNRIEKVLEMVKLKDRSKDKFKTYSLGMKQRLGIASAILINPKLVILDEPTNGLDPQGMKDIKEIITTLADRYGITFFISSHLLHDVEQICTKVGILKDGQLIAQGNVSDLLNMSEEVVEITTAEKSKVESVLMNMRFVKSVKVNENGLIVKLDKGNSYKLNQLLIENGIVVNLKNLQNNTLEKLFFELTEGEKK
jgi:ABC-type multidrug transport system ATPase subunit